MVEIHAMTNEHKFWNKTIDFAENCSWKAGAYLAVLMKKNKFIEWERVFVAYENDRVVGYCTFVEKDELLEKICFFALYWFCFC